MMSIPSFHRTFQHWFVAAVVAACMMMMTTTTRVVNGQPTTTTYQCQWSEEVSLHKDETVFLRQYMNVDDGTFTIQLRYTDGFSWVGIGINTDKKSDMMPAWAVIGDVDRGIRRYRLSSDAKDGSGVVPFDDSDATGSSSLLVTGGSTSFEQNADTGESILTFTHSLSSTSEGWDVSDLTTTWIWAVGLPDNVWEGKHKVHGSFQGLQFFDSCIQQQQDTTTTAPLPTQLPTLPPTTTATTTTDTDSTTTTTTTTTIAPTTTTTMPPTSQSTTIEVVIGTVDNTNTNNNNNNDSSSSSTTPSSGITSPGNGGDFGSSISFVESTSVETRGLWIIHGIFMGVAWGVFAPLAIGSAFVRNWTVLKTNGRWLSLHFYLSLCVVLLTIVGFIVAIIATNKEGDLPHFQEDVHHKAGLAIFVLVFVQALAGYARPSPPSAPKKPQQEDSSDGMNEETSSDASPSGGGHSRSIDVVVGGGGQDDSPSKQTVMSAASGSEMTTSNVDEIAGDNLQDVFNNAVSSSTSQPATSKEQNHDDVHDSKPSPSSSSSSLTTKFMIRKTWECVHRVSGVALLGLAWYNCHSGIILQAETYDQDDEELLLNIFWGVTGGIAGTIFVFGYGLRL